MEALVGAPTGSPSREVVVLPGEVEVVVAPELVADLYDPTLVISPAYVGPDRRRADRSVRSRSGFPLWLRRVLEVVFLTMIVVVPLTMIAARSVPPAATGAPTTQAQPSGTGAAPTGAARTSGRHHGSSHVFTASSRQIARAEAAYQRALARVGAAEVAPTPAPPVSGDGAGTGAVRASQQTAPDPSGASATAQQQRDASEAQSAQNRATNQAAASQRRATRAATQAANQAGRAATAAGRSATGTQPTGT